MIKDIGDCIRMNDQLILKFPSHRAYKKEDFYVSPSNQEAYDFINSWPKWIKRTVNVFGPSGSGKSHLASILKSKSLSLLLFPVGEAPLYSSSLSCPIATCSIDI